MARQSGEFFKDLARLLVLSCWSLNSAAAVTNIAIQEGTTMHLHLRAGFAGLALALATAALPAAALADSFGAIAYSPDTGANGWSHDYPSRRGAERAAQDNCDADDCRIAIWFKNACGAVAVGSNGGWGSDWGGDRRRAQSKAIRACSRNDDGCSVVRWQCSGAN